MAEVTIPDVSDDMIRWLEASAAFRGITLEEEVVRILTERAQAFMAAQQAPEPDAP